MQIMLVHSDAVLLADVSENLWNKYMKINELDPAHFLSGSGLAWQVCLKKTRINLLILMRSWWLKKELEMKHVMQYIGMQKQIINVSNIMIKIKNHHTSCI